MTVKDKVVGMLQSDNVRAVHVWAGRQPVVDETTRMYESMDTDVFDRSGVLSLMEELFPEGVARKKDGAFEYTMFPNAGAGTGFTVRKVF